MVTPIIFSNGIINCINFIGRKKSNIKNQIVHKS